MLPGMSSPHNQYSLLQPVLVRLNLVHRSKGDFLANPCWIEDCYSEVSTTTAISTDDSVVFSNETTQSLGNTWAPGESIL